MKRSLAEFIRQNSSEISHEVTYKINLADWFVVQYDVQYVIHPSANPSFSNAIAGGIQLELLFCKY
jgi:carbohydrate-selective porin OprB